MPERRALKLAVIGDPVAHSASPALHRGFLAAAGIDGSYEAIRVASGTGAAAIDDLRARGYTGLNVTTPLKEEAFARADERDPAAVAAGSANTLVLDDRISGYNTDGLGAIGALHDCGITTLAATRILVLGAGPTARSCLASLVAHGAVAVIWNRTPGGAARAADALGANVWHAGEPEPDAVISALPPHARLEDPRLRADVLAAPVVIDANYGERATLAEFLGRNVTDGYAMLRASARASFELFKSVLV